MKLLAHLIRFPIYSVFWGSSTKTQKFVTSNRRPIWISYSHIIPSKSLIIIMEHNPSKKFLESPWPSDYKYSYRITVVLLVKRSRVWYYRDDDWIGLSLELLPDPNRAKLNFPNDSKQSSHQLVCEREKSIFRGIDTKLHFINFISWEIIRLYREKIRS